MSGWPPNLAFDDAPSAGRASSRLGRDAGAAEPVNDGTPPLERGRVESSELGPLAKLPPFAPMTIRLLRLFDRDDLGPAEIVKLVEADPTVAAEALSMVNSPLYPLRGSVVSAAHAAAILGVDQMRALATTLALRAILGNSPKTGTVRRFWKHSVASAVIAHHLAPCFGVDQGLGYIAAVVHDLGRIGLLAAHPEEYGCVAAARHESVEAVLAAERARFGMDHCAAGSLLAEAWGLPDVLRNAIARHHDASVNPGAAGLAQAACQLADAFMFQSILHADRQTPAGVVQRSLPRGAERDWAVRLERLKLTTFEAIESFHF